MAFFFSFFAHSTLLIQDGLHWRSLYVRSHELTHEEACIVESTRSQERMEFYFPIQESRLYGPIVLVHSKKSQSARVFLKERVFSLIPSRGPGGRFELLPFREQADFLLALSDSLTVKRVGYPGTVLSLLGLKEALTAVRQNCLERIDNE